MNKAFKTQALNKHPRYAARTLAISTPHGKLTTPCFMPVATRAYVNHMTPQDLINTHSQIILGGNTYHMLCNPGLSVIEKAGGMHNMMGWQRPMLTDSGGFQVFSLAKNGKLCKIDDNGARFKHPTSGETLYMTPQSSIAAQKVIGADIIMAFDQCTPEAGGRVAALQAMTRTHQWLALSKEAHDNNPCSVYGHPQALFGIIQGGSFEDLRIESAQHIIDMDTDGIAIGGETIGFDMPKTLAIAARLVPLLPENKARYTMGVGLNPQDLIDVVKQGIDLFDCVAPTRNARHGALYHGRVVKEGDWLRFDNQGADRSRILIKKSQYRMDEEPILAGCDCQTCQHYSRAYLHFLLKTQSPLYYQLACIHNVHVMQDVCQQLRDCIHAHSNTNIELSSKFGP